MSQAIATPIINDFPFFEDFIEEAGATTEIKTAYLQAMETFSSWMREKAVAIVTLSVMRDFMEALQPIYGAPTVSFYAMAIRNYYGWMEEARGVESPLSLRLPRLLEDFLRDLDGRTTTKGTYERSIRQYIAWVNVEGRTGLSRSDIKDYKTHLLAHHEPNTVHTYFTALRSFFSYLEAEYDIKNPTVGIKSVKVPRKSTKDSLEPEQVIEILQAIETDTEKGRRDKAIISLMVSTGLRTIEVSRANVKNLHPKGRKTFLDVWGKGQDGTNGSVMVHPYIMSVLSSYLRLRTDKKGSSPLFTSTANENKGERLSTRTISKIVKERMKAVGIDVPTLTAHSLRHTAITSALKGGATIREAQEMGRHGNIETTLRYAHEIERENNPAEERAVSYLFGDYIIHETNISIR